MSNRNWRPSASIENLKARARIIQNIRAFFDHRAVIEVETPALDHFGVTDPYLNSMVVKAFSENQTHKYLQTSPEYAMKRLLAAGFGDCYQICKAFREDETGKYHQSEFTILEWYRLNFSDQDLIIETDHFLQQILGTAKAESITYQAVFIKFLQIDPVNCSLAELQRLSKKHTTLNTDLETKEDYLMWLFSQCIESEIANEKPCFVTSFPAAQASLSRVDPNNQKLSCRFEVYFKGVELGNGFYELNQADEQLQRFQNNVQKRQLLNKPKMAIDNRLIDALKYGLPDCSGIAMGIDRLIMLALKAESIQEVMSFSDKSS